MGIFPVGGNHKIEFGKPEGVSRNLQKILQFRTVEAKSQSISKARSYFMFEVKEKLLLIAFSVMVFYLDD